MISLLLLFSCSDQDLKGYNIIPQIPDVDPNEVTQCDFTPIPNSKVSEYDCNPVFQDFGEDIRSMAFHTTSVLGHPFYQMWYLSTPSADSMAGYNMNYAISDDGVEWTPHENNPAFAANPTAWDKDYFIHRGVVWDAVESEYIMIYHGADLGVPQIGMGVATSPDGIDWTREAAPVIDFPVTVGSTLPNSQLVPCFPLSIAIHNNNLSAFLAANPNPNSEQCNIYKMDAMSLTSWNVNTTAPVLEAVDGTHEAMGFSGATIVEFENALYMFYIAFQTWEYEDTDGDGNADRKYTSQATLNLATSTDGGNSWVKDPNNPLPIHQDPAILKITSVGAQVVGSRIHLWITDQYNSSKAVGYFYYEPNVSDH